MPKIEPKVAVCLTTVANESQGEKIAKFLVDRKLAACVTLIPRVVSVYRWKKKLCRDKEVFLIIKTVSSKIKKLENSLKQIHPYDVPEFLVLPVRYGSKPYLEWILRQT